MATLQKFKLLATQCGVAPSPTRSPRTSPVVHLRRRKTTLRMLLSRTTTTIGRRSHSPAQTLIPSIFSPLKKDKKKEKENENDDVATQSRSLKDLFVSSPPLEESNHRGEMEEMIVVKAKSEGIGGGFDNWRTGPGSPKPVWNGFRYRSLLRRAWRPVLVTIPE